MKATVKDEEVTGKRSRRQFLQAAGAGTAITIVRREVLGGSGFIAPSDRVSVALIGAGSQGIGDMRNLLQEPDAQVVAIADPSRENPTRANRRSGGRLPAVQVVRESDQERGRPSKPCADYEDFRLMLDRQKDIDAVLIATPDHTHAIAVMAAIQLGKHVFCEKPLCHSIYELRRITEAARQKGIATQMGNQGHSSEGIRLTCEWIWDGAIGPVREVHGWTNFSYYEEPGRRPNETPPVPDGLNWDLWLGPAPKRPYHPLYHPGRWRRWQDFGTGVLGDFACHHLNPAFWALKLGPPTRVSVERETPGLETFPKASRVTYEFPARADMPSVKMVWHDGGLMPERPPELEPDRDMSQDGGHGVLFVGDRGKILGGGWSNSPRLIPETVMQSYRRPPKTIPRSKGHLRDWLDACKGGPPASANFDDVAVMVEAILLGVIAVITGESLQWDASAMRVTNSAAANDWVSRPYQNGWTL
jgi:predicted dehydrogenase